jgi:hypothetical protein
MVAGETATEDTMRRHTRLVCAAAVMGGLALATLASSASAQTFGRQGDISFSAERLMGLYLVDDGARATYIGLGAPAPDHSYANARLGVDGFVTDHLSVGGALALWSIDPAHGGSVTGGLIAPRIGYAIDFSRAFGFWPRGGLTYRNVGGDEELALTLEGMFYASPAPHFAFTFGPAIDLGLVGDGAEARSFGVVTFGIMGWI